MTLEVRVQETACGGDNAHALLGRAKKNCEQLYVQSKVRGTAAPHEGEAVRRGARLHCAGRTVP